VLNGHVRNDVNCAQIVSKTYDTIQHNNAKTILKKGHKSLNSCRIVSFRVVLSDRLSRLKIPWGQPRESSSLSSGTLGKQKAATV
jgi:hypothetical protein